VTRITPRFGDGLGPQTRPTRTGSRPAEHGLLVVKRYPVYTGAVRFLWIARVALLVLATAVMPADPAGAKTTKPAPPTRTAINTCDQAWLYSWPTDSALPVRGHFPPSHAGEQFELLGTVRYTLEGRGYYETTVPVISGSGSGAHYWVSDVCVNPPPFPTPKANSPSRT